MNTHPQIVSKGKSVASLCAALAVSGVLFLSVKGMAQIDITGQASYTMSDGGSTATVNVGNSGTLGMNSWTVLGGQNQLNQQWFWYSVNGAAPQPINTLSAATVYNMNGDPGLDDIGVNYQQDGGLQVFAEYQLSGNGMMSGSADMLEGIYIINNSSSSINLSFYQYSNFNLLQNNNNSVNISGSPGAYTGALQTTGGPGGTGLGEVILGPNANNAEAAQVPQTLNELGAATYLTLNDTTSANNGDVSWAFQWNTTLAADGGELDLRKDKGLSVTIVPEPSTMAFIALCLGTLGLARRRQSA